MTGCAVYAIIYIKVGAAKWLVYLMLQSTYYRKWAE